MRFVDIINKKRENTQLSEQDIKYWIKGVVNETIPDYQTSALLMAIVLNGMNEKETYILANEMMKSGDIIDLSSIEGIKVDKHSTGGVGDKTTIVLAPMLASCGLKIAKMSGRGLGHTGGTIDKLESIENFNCFISENDFIKQVEKIGVAISGQTGNVVPADKKLYSLRDVTATVNSIPLIASSIMSKKLALGSDIILLDVKYGEGAFMKTFEDAQKLSESMISIGKSAGRKTIAVITNMNQPLGNAIGNSLEIKEAVQTLKGNGPEDFTELCIECGKIMLVQSGICKNDEQAEILLNDVISTGKAFDKFKQMVKAQGGNVKMIEDLSYFPKAKYITEIRSDKSGYIKNIHSQNIGVLAMQLGAGRAEKNDKINYKVGIILNCKIGRKLNRNDIICFVHHDELLEKKWINELKESFEFDSNFVEQEPLIKKIIL